MNISLIRRGLVKSGIASHLRFNHQHFEASQKKLEIDLKGLIYIEGWHFRCHELTHKYKSEIISAFNSSYKIHHPLLPKIAKDKRVKLAVHIRRGDYKTWLGGKYFYCDLIYQKMICQFVDLINEETLVIFFTDDPGFKKESIETKGAESLNSAGDAWQDYALMSNCDYIIGPPSTFSMWASYIGSKPLFRINDPDEELVNLNQFSVVNG